MRAAVPYIWSGRGKLCIRRSGFSGSCCWGRQLARQDWCLQRRSAAPVRCSRGLPCAAGRCWCRCSHFSSFPLCSCAAGQGRYWGLCSVRWHGSSGCAAGGRWGAAHRVPGWVCPGGGCGGRSRAQPGADPAGGVGPSPGLHLLRAVLRDPHGRGAAAGQPGAGHPPVCSAGAGRVSHRRSAEPSAPGTRCPRYALRSPPRLRRPGWTK